MGGQDSSANRDHSEHMSDCWPLQKGAYMSRALVVCSMDDRLNSKCSRVLEPLSNAVITMCNILRLSQRGAAVPRAGTPATLDYLVR
jgi:hypothetical protein